MCPINNRSLMNDRTIKQTANKPPRLRIAPPLFKQHTLLSTAARNRSEPLFHEEQRALHQRETCAAMNTNISRGCNCRRPIIQWRATALSRLFEHTIMSHYAVSLCLSSKRRQRRRRCCSASHCRTHNPVTEIFIHRGCSRYLSTAPGEIKAPYVLMKVSLASSLFELCKIRLVENARTTGGDS